MPLKTPCEAVDFSGSGGNGKAAMGLSMGDANSWSICNGGCGARGSASSSAPTGGIDAGWGGGMTGEGPGTGGADWR